MNKKNIKFGNIVLASALLFSGVMLGYEISDGNNLTYADDSLETEPVVVKRDSWSNKGLTNQQKLQFNALVYSDGSVNIECINKEYMNTGGTYSMGLMEFDDMYYDSNYTSNVSEYKGPGSNDGVVTVIKQYTENGLGFEYVLAPTTGSYYFTLGEVFNITITPKSNPTGIADVEAFGHTIQISQELFDKPIGSTEKFDLNEDGMVNVLDLFDLKRYLLDVNK